MSRKGHIAGLIDGIRAIARILRTFCGSSPSILAFGHFEHALDDLVERLEEES